MTCFHFDNDHRKFCVLAGSVIVQPRVPIPSHERFFAVVIEAYEGTFIDTVRLLAPEAVVVLLRPTYDEVSDEVRPILTHCDEIGLVDEKRSQIFRNRLHDQRLLHD